MWRKLISLSAVLAVALLVQACAKPPDPETACNFVQNAEKQRVSWNDRTPVTMYIDASFPQQFRAATQAAADQWNAALGRTIIKIGGVLDKNTTPSKDGSNIVYWQSQWEANKPSEQARTTVYWSGSQIYEADVRINGKFNYFINTAEPGKIDIVSLLVHEFGHVLGLAHDDSNGSVMAYSLAAATSTSDGLRRIPQKIDIDSIRCEY